MRRSKSRKIEVGTSRPTENRAINVIFDEQITEWLGKVRQADKLLPGDGVTSSINRVVDVLIDLIKQTQDGKYSREVISGLARRQNIQASLAVAQKRLARSG